MLISILSDILISALAAKISSLPNEIDKSNRLKDALGVKSQIEVARFI